MLMIGALAALVGLVALAIVAYGVARLIDGDDDE